MVLFDTTLDLALVIFVVVALAEYAKYRQKREKAFRLLAGAGFLFVLSAVFSLPEVVLLGISTSLQAIFQVIAQIVAFIAVLMLGYEAIKEYTKKKK